MEAGGGREKGEGEERGEDNEPPLPLPRERPTRLPELEGQERREEEMGRGPGREDRGGRGARTGEGIGASKGCGQKREHWGRKDCSEPRVPPRPMPGSHLGKKLCKKGEGRWLGERPARQRTRAGGLAWEARASHKGLRTKVSEGRSRTPADRRCTSPEHTEECP